MALARFMLDCSENKTQESLVVRMRKLSAWSKTEALHKPCEGLLALSLQHGVGPCFV